MLDVLVAIDDDAGRALAQADAVTNLAPTNDAVRAVLLHVFTDNPEGATVDQIHSIRRARDRLDEAGVDVELASTSGDPAEEILREAERRDVNVISVAGRNRSPAGKAILGSVSQQVLLRADRPVLFSNDD